MSMKTEEQVTAEIAALQAIKPKVRQFTAFHDDNHAGIDAQIQVLTDRMDSEQVHDKYLLAAGAGDHVFFEALHASDWLYGLLAIDEDKAPSLEWQSLTE